MEGDIMIDTLKNKKEKYITIGLAYSFQKKKYRQIFMI